jgi:DNA polymerase III alpha subunit
MSFRIAAAAPHVKSAKRSIFPTISSIVSPRFSPVAITRITLRSKGNYDKPAFQLAHPRTAPFLALYKAIYGLPRHLGQHSGGMIICKDKLSSMVPLENASMPGRSVAQWDKDDCDNLGIIKVDLLGLGMMSVLQETIELCARTATRSISRKSQGRSRHI